MNELTAFAEKLEWMVRFLYGVRRVLAAATSEEEAAAWTEWLAEERWVA